MTCEKSHITKSWMLQIIDIFCFFFNMSDDNFSKKLYFLHFWPFSGIILNAQMTNAVNKGRPKGPHIVHLSTMWWYLYWQIRQNCHLVFPIRRKKHKLGRGLWDLASCQFSLNSIQRFQRRSLKCLKQSDARAAIFFFWSPQKTQTW